MLLFINGECSGAGYKIFSFEELISGMPKPLSIDNDGLRECILTLISNEYISVKYQDEGEVCLKPRLKGRILIESKEDKERESKLAERRLLFFGYMGGFLGAITAFVFAFIIRLLGGI